MKIGLYLMTKKGFEVLSYLIKKKIDKSILFVCIGQDKNVENDYSLELQNLCLENNLLVFFRGEKYLPEADFSIAISWRWIINVSNLIVLHDSILPKYRGFAPLVNSLIKGEKTIGVSAIYADSDYDKGDIILQKAIEIYYPIKIKDAIDKVSVLYSEIVYELLKNKNIKRFNSTKQVESEASYSLWLDEEDYFIDWEENSEVILRKINACGFPYTGAKTKFENDTIRIDEAQIVQDLVIENRVSGKHLFNQNEFPVIVCGVGLLKITKAYNISKDKNFFPLNIFRFRLK